MLKMKPREFTEADEKDPIGLVNGGVVQLECSSCGRGLVNIFRTQPNALDPATKKPFQWKMKAKCCFCGSQSYIKEVTGKFYLGGYAKSEDDDNAETSTDGFDEVNIEGESVLVIKTVKT